MVMSEKIKAVITFRTGESIRLTLRPDEAPLTVKNFVELAESGFYDGLCMHRVIPGFMIQGGGMTSENGKLHVKKAPRNIIGEFRANGHANSISHLPGVISMARTPMPDSASSQFFICVADCTFLDGQYAAFGTADDEGSVEAAVKISGVPTHSQGMYDDVPVDPVVIDSVKIIRANA